MWPGFEVGWAELRGDIHKMARMPDGLGRHAQESGSGRPGLDAQLWMGKVGIFTVALL
jgi:hypothetical protein